MNRYCIVKNKHYGKITMNYRNFDGFKVKPRNMVKREGIKVDSLTVTNRDFINQVLKKKTKKKLELYLQYIISIIDDEESTDPVGVRIALDDLARYKAIIDFNYRKYLDSKYISLLIKKIELLERELKMKIINLEKKTKSKNSKQDITRLYQEKYMEEPVQEEKSRRSR